MRVAQEREKIDHANRLVLEEINGKLQDIQNEERRVKEQILLSDERFKIEEELAEAQARIEVCTKFEGKEESFRTINDIPCDNTHDRVEHYLQSQPIQDAPPLNELEHTDYSAYNQGTGPTPPVGNQMANTSPLIQLVSYMYHLLRMIYISPNRIIQMQEVQTQRSITIFTQRTQVSYRAISLL